MSNGKGAGPFHVPDMSPGMFPAKFAVACSRADGNNANETCQHNAGQWLTRLRASPGMAIRVHYGDAVRHA